MLKSIGSVKWLADVSQAEFLPRGYNLSDPAEMDSFLDDFKCQRAVNLLKELVDRFKRDSSISGGVLVNKGAFILSLVSSHWCSVTAVFEICSTVLNRAVRSSLVDEDALDLPDRVCSRLYSPDGQLVQDIGMRVSLSPA